MVVEIKKYENGNIIEWRWASNNNLIPIPFFTSCYFIDGLLIDSGPPAGVNDLREFIKLISEKNHIDMCIITHTHEDHSGGAYLLQEEFNIPIYTNEKAIPILNEEKHYPFYRQIAWGEKREAVKAKKINKDFVSTENGYFFEVFPMPGHANELIALIEKSKGWIFASDAIQPKYRMLFGCESDIQENISQIYNSINNLYETIKEMKEVRIFISGHNVYRKSLIKEKLDEINKLREKVQNFYNEIKNEYQNEEKLLKKVMKAVLGRETVIGRLTNGDLSSMNLIKELVEWEI